MPKKEKDIVLNYFKIAAKPLSQKEICELYCIEKTSLKRYVNSIMQSISKKNNKKTEKKAQNICKVEKKQLPLF